MGGSSPTSFQLELLVFCRKIAGSQSQTVSDSPHHVLSELFIAQQQVVAAIHLREYISSASESLRYHYGWILLILGHAITKFNVTIVQMLRSQQLYSEATSLCTNLAECQKLIRDLESCLPSELTNIEEHFRTSCL